LELDLLVTTTAKKEDDVYWDAVAGWPVNVDVVVREPGQRIGDWIALGFWHPTECFTATAQQ